MSEPDAMKPGEADPPRRGATWHPDLAYAAALFLLASIALGVMLQREGFLAAEFGWGSALFFIVFGVFTITMGFPHPRFGHVSFDRVAQISAILVLGPVDAAWISGLASLIYPWKRLFEGETLTTVTTASLHNAGLMTLVVLVCGSIYVAAGGPVPITVLDAKTMGLLLLLILSMQFANDLGMVAIFRLRHQDPSQLLNRFTAAVELGSVLIGVLVALVYVRDELAVFVLLLVVLSIGMLVLKRYAEMRARLEALVDERTEELRIKTQELERQATHDTLTGIYNRRFADDYLHREIERNRRANRNFTVALADIDHFKQINDRFSHATGDLVLQRVAKILSCECRKHDVVARYGGEEFLLCFPDANIEFAAQACSKLRAAVEAAQWSSIAADVGPDFVITLSFGIAEARPDSRPATLLGEADSRLYQAKNRGRNRVVAVDLPA